MRLEFVYLFNAEELIAVNGITEIRDASHSNLVKIQKIVNDTNKFEISDTNFNTYFQYNTYIIHLMSSRRQLDKKDVEKGIKLIL